MKDVTLALRTGYYTLLNNMVVDGKTIPAFDLEAPSGTPTPYIIISEIFSKSENTKDGFGDEVVIDLLAFNKYAGDFGGRKLTDLIANEILTRAIPTPGRAGVSASGLNVYMAKKVGVSDEMDYASTGRNYRKRVTIEHLIEEI